MLWHGMIARLSLSHSGLEAQNLPGSMDACFYLQQAEPRNGSAICIPEFSTTIQGRYAVGNHSASCC